LKLLQYRYIIKSLRSENTYLRDENSKIPRLASTVERIKVIDRRLKQMLGSGVEATKNFRFTVKTSFEGSSEVPSQPIDSEFEEIEWAVLRQRALSHYIPSIWPVKGWVTAEFEESSKSLGKRHIGIDIAAPRNEAVKATADGVVESSGYDSDLGNMIVLKHGRRFMTRYGHNSSVLVNVGEFVKRGQPIALVGSTGKSTASHLHYEVWKDDEPVNPRDFMIGE
jgi:murein DD-endopeptidase MepM/ murein hydrolase activator NlpD